MYQSLFFNEVEYVNAEWVTGRVLIVYLIIISIQDPIFIEMVFTYIGKILSFNTAKIWVNSTNSLIT